jgi:uncharacterized protein YecE (DUF72 family)
VALHIGIAGWSYADWQGKVYPANCRDTLAFCARYVDLIEIDSTFYATPAPATVASWVERTAARGTRFTAKLGRQFTHERQLVAAEVDAYRAALAPLAESGRLVALLAQFSAAFVCDEAARLHLAALVAAFGDFTKLAVEVRHVSWQDEAALAFLRDLGVTVVQLDYPTRADSFSLADPGIHAAGFAYLRLHGRSAAWFDRNAGRDAVYDWLYPADQVRELAQRARAVHQAVGRRWWSPTTTSRAKR